MQPTIVAMDESSIFEMVEVARMIVPGKKAVKTISEWNFHADPVSLDF